MKQTLFFSLFIALLIQGPVASALSPGWSGVDTRRAQPINEMVRFGRSWCTADLIIMPGMTMDDKAIAVTAGHCSDEFSYRKAAPGHWWGDPPVKDISYEGLSWRNRVGAWVNLPSNHGPLQRDENFEKPGSPGTHFILADKLIFASMKGTDLALYELNLTYGELKAIIDPLFSTMRDKYKGNGFRLGFHEVARTWPKPEQPLFFPWLDNGRDTWIFNYDAEAPQTSRYHDIRNPICDHWNAFEIPGMSGSPLLDDNLVAYGIASVHDINDNGPSRSCAAPLAPLHGCYDPATRKFNFDLETCTLR